jgi:hypothetical protein
MKRNNKIDKAKIDTLSARQALCFAKVLLPPVSRSGQLYKTGALSNRAS